MSPPVPLRPKKSLGQHFLRDEEILETILRTAALSPADLVLEIGAGDGTLTRPLGEKAKRVIAIETDRRCLTRLRRLFPPGGRVEVVEADILQYDFTTLNSLAPLKSVSDLPYTIATAVLDRLLENRSLFSLMVLMFQKEVALRLTASHGSKAFGSLSLATQYRAEVELIRTVPPGSFSPPPQVDSALVRVVPRASSLLAPSAEKVFHRLIRAGFRSRRKTFLNSLSKAGFPLPAKTVAAALETIDAPAAIRAEDLSFEDYLMLSRRLAPIMHDATQTW